MKPEELMVGDLLYDKANDYYGEVTGVIDNGEIYIDGVIAYIADCTPIPLTPEILEKYGFRFVSGGAWDYFYLKEIKWFDLFKKENGFALHIGQSEIYLNYLHELQHALKLCGIEKTIEL